MIAAWLFSPACPSCDCLTCWLLFVLVPDGFAALLRRLTFVIAAFTANIAPARLLPAILLFTILHFLFGPYIAVAGVMPAHAFL